MSMQPSQSGETIRNPKRRTKGDADENAQLYLALDGAVNIEPISPGAATVPAENGRDIEIEPQTRLSSSVPGTAPSAKKKKSTSRARSLEPILASGGTNIFENVAAEMDPVNI